jgi:UDP-2,4-diacetamido-2,4,6-trideoxy-beta-L-altropyranose hydrolase
MRLAHNDTELHQGRLSNNSSPTVAIRVDSGSHVGGGHLLRCLTLADELRRLGASVHFVSREYPGHLLARLSDCGHVVHRLPAVPGTGSASMDDAESQARDAMDTLAALRDQHIDWLIADHYGVDAAWESLVRPGVERLMVIDDLADRAHDADLLVDQNYFGSETLHRYEGRIPQRCHALLGPRYALLHPDYRRLRASWKRHSGTIRRVLVFFGMHDPTRAALKVLQALSHPEFSAISVDVVAGNDPSMTDEICSAARARHGTAVRDVVTSLAELMADVDLAIGAGGATTWERACLGVPAIVATIADNQVGLANVLAAEGFIVLLGRSALTSSDTWRLVLRRLISDPDRVAELGSHARALTDGYGTARVARHMLGGMTNVVVRRSSTVDETLLLEWANDPGTRHFAFNKNRITPEQHHLWFLSRLIDPGCMMLIGEDGHGLPVGQVRFDLNAHGDEATINVSVDVALRGMGIGSLLLQEAMAAWRRERPRTPIIAEIVEGNEASKRLFASAGFSPVTSRRPETITFEYRPG